MNIGMYQSAASLSALERWQDSVAQNITSSQVTGFRKRTINFSTQAAGEIQFNPRKTIGHEAGSPMLFPKVNSGINYVSGEAQPTRRDFDVAIQGEGFFEMQRADVGWKQVLPSRYARRITASTPMQLSGPAAGNAMLKTAADPSGTNALGTFNNCANGHTP